MNHKILSCIFLLSKMTSSIMKNLSPILKQSPINQPNEDLNLKYISGPITWTGFAFGDREIHLFGDAHSSKAGNCKELGVKDCISSIDQIIPSDCINIDTLLDMIFRSCEKNGIRGDLFLESYYQSKKDKRERELYSKTLEGYIPDVDKIFNQFQKEPRVYTRVNNIDIRIDQQSSIEPIDILYSTLLNSYERFKNNQKFLIEFYEMLTQIIKTLDVDDLIYFFGDTENKLIHLTEGLNNLYQSNKQKKIYRILGDALRLILQNINVKNIEKIKKFQQQNITFQEKNVIDIVQDYISKRINDRIKEESYSTNYLERIDFMLTQILNITSLIMDHYVLFMMIKSIQKGSKILITQAGNFHIQNYIQFFTNVFQLKPMPYSVSVPGQEIIRCVKNPNFGKIFGKWIDSDYKSSLLSQEPYQIEIIGPNRNYIYDHQKHIRSGEGEVYLGKRYNKDDEELLEIKVINKKEKNIYDNEVQCLKKLLRYCDKYGVSCINDAFEEYDKQYILTSYLKDYMILREFIEIFAYKYTQYIVEKIYYKLYKIINDIHKAGVAHGNINLENITVYVGGIQFDSNQVIVEMDPFDVRLLDFGLCNTKDQEQDYVDLDRILGILEKNKA